MTPAGLPLQTGKSMGKPKRWLQAGHPWVLLDHPGPGLADPPGVPGELQGAWGAAHAHLPMHLAPEQHSTG